VHEFDKNLLLLECKSYLSGNIKEGDRAWEYSVIWRSYIEGISKRGRKWIRDVINFPREDFDEKYESLLLSNYKKNWEDIKFYAFEKPDIQILTNAFILVTSELEEFAGRYLAKEMEKWDIEQFRSFARRERYEISEDDFELLIKTINKLEFDNFYEVFPILRNGFITQLFLETWMKIRELTNTNLWYKFKL
jgi:hypothetical protein